MIIGMINYILIAGLLVNSDMEGDFLECGGFFMFKKWVVENTIYALWGLYFLAASFLCLHHVIIKLLFADTSHLKVCSSDS